MEEKRLAITTYNLGLVAGGMCGAAAPVKTPKDAAILVLLVFASLLACVLIWDKESRAIAARSRTSQVTSVSVTPAP